MAIVKGPAMSMDASGSLAGAVVFSKWKGRNYVRALVTPANPKSGAQTGFRASMKFLAQIWSSLTSSEKATFEARADDMIVSPFNAFTSMNQKRWRNFLTPSKEDPPAEASSAPSALTMSVTAGVRMATVSMADGGTAPDWGIVLFRSTTSGFTPSVSNCIALVEEDASGTTEYVDTPLEPGTYYYKCQGFNDDGIDGTVSSEATVTIV